MQILYVFFFSFKMRKACEESAEWSIKYQAKSLCMQSATSVHTWNAPTCAQKQKKIPPAPIVYPLTLLTFVSPILTLEEEEELAFFYGWNKSSLLDWATCVGCLNFTVVAIFCLCAYNIPFLWQISNFKWHLHSPTFIQAHILRNKLCRVDRVPFPTSTVLATSLDSLPTTTNTNQPDAFEISKCHSNNR